MDNSLQTEVPELSTSAPQSVPESLPVESQAPPEKMVPQSKVNDLIRSAMAKASDKARNQTMEEVHRQNANQTSSFGGMKQLSEEDIQQRIQEATQNHINQLQQNMAQQQQTQYANQLINEFTSKLVTGSEKYADFDKKVSSLKLDKFPNLVILGNKVSNTADVIYDLANNPLKAAQIDYLAKMDPESAISEMNKLSESIKTNQQASDQRKPYEPLSSIKPSITATDNGEHSVTSLRNQDWLKA